ncbi:hypothetical protein [Nocardioides antri]|uniref:DUF1906 domain-containing protein n=1 Tax=Nocardioides antri TaxID=2607659 RepID=A0A5B1M548_9ACTN|nr:hypothetical protein [Nocardioides antri]KAA1426877.1 hypothetical protein F0U47_11870 [Nocardioides antri]
MRRALATAVVLVMTLVGACGEEGGEEPRADTTTSDAPKGDKGKKRDSPSGQGEPGDEASNLADMAEDLANEAAGTIPPRDGPVQGADISWPQCPEGMGIPEKQSLGLPMPVPEAEFVVIGLTNGPGFTPNPCLADQVAWVQERELLAAAYAVSSYPDEETLELYAWDGPYDGGSLKGRLRNVGYQQARFNIDSMIDAGLQSPLVWIDVEPVPYFEWSDDPGANAAVVEGAARGYTEAGYAIGVYSTPYLWETVVGDFRLGVPEWRAAGETSREEALNRCGDDWSIQGGPAVLGQWVADNRDHNVTCPGISEDLGRWFHQY